MAVGLVRLAVTSMGALSSRYEAKYIGVSEGRCEARMDRGEWKEVGLRGWGLAGTWRGAG